MAELFFDVPVDYTKPNDGTLRLFARSVSRLHTPIDSERGNDSQLPWMVYLQGGPGMGCRAPQEYGWIGTVLDKGYQVCFRLACVLSIKLLFFILSHRVMLTTPCERLDLVPRPAWYRSQLDHHCGDSCPTGKCRQAGCVFEKFPR